MHREKIVIVEDDHAMREALLRLLSVAGFSVFGFPSGEAFLDSGNVAESACMVIDIHLPGLSGLEVRRLLVASGSRARVIFITAHDDEQTREEAMSSGADAYFTKPFQGRHLIEAIESAIRLQRAETDPGTV